MRKEYQIASRDGSAELRQFLAQHGQALLPMVELIEQGRLAVEQLVDDLGRAALEAVLLVSAEQVAGPAHPGRPAGEVRRHGSQGGVVALGGQRMRVRKPRLRRKSGGKAAEVAVPAYAAMQSDEGLRERLLSILLRGVSTRNYQQVLPEMADRCGVSKSAVSRQFQAASAQALKTLCERRFDELELLVIYLDGKDFGGHQVVYAVGVDAEGRKHVLGLTEGATENAVVVKGLLEDLVERGVRPDRRRLLVIDGSKALRKAIDEVYGRDNPVQRCQAHKRRNVIGYLPKELQAQTAAALRAAWKLEPKEGMARLRTQIAWLEREHPKAAASLREGMEETFTINALGLSPKLRKCLATTNVIESSLSGVQGRSGRVTRWRDGEMALRWAAAAALQTEKGFRKIMGHRDLWILKAALDQGQLVGEKPLIPIDEGRVAA
ncbi:MAG: IS256 family transposase [Methyloceanibacter sp.]|nr:IS256 family transposase [Methyloceanibacter sp.]